MAVIAAGHAPGLWCGVCVKQPQQAVEERDHGAVCRFGRIPERDSLLRGGRHRRGGGEIRRDIGTPKPSEAILRRAIMTGPSRPRRQP